MLRRPVSEPPVPELFRRRGDATALLAADEPTPFDFVQLGGRAPALLICDHASRYVPRALGDLGVDPAELARHIAWDIGAAEMTMALARRLDAPAVLCGFSRLVIDPNRRLGSTSSIPEESDRTLVPGNLGLAEADRDARVESLFKPYHAAVARLIEAQMARGLTPALLFLHSFTPVMGGIERPWQAGILWDNDPRLAQPLIDGLRGHGLKVGDNEPYSGRSTEDYSLHAHAESRGLPCALIEVRQDLIDTHHGAAEWARLLHQVLGPLLADPATFAPVAPFREEAS